jgi:hypothetical protein
MILEPATALCNPIELATTASAGALAADTDIARLGFWRTGCSYYQRESRAALPI